MRRMLPIVGFSSFLGRAKLEKTMRLSDPIIKAADISLQ
jgi:hypothetical protein